MQEKDIKKVLFVCSLYYPHIGGIEIFIEEFAGALIEKGVEVVVLTKKWPQDQLSDYDEYKGVKIYRVISAKTDEEFIDCAHTISVIESDIRADIVHAVGMRRPLPLFAHALSKRWGVPLVTTYAGGELPEDEASQKIWDDSKEFAIPATYASQWSVTFSEDLVRLIESNVTDTVPIDVVHAGVRLDAVTFALPIDLGYKYILSARRLDYPKGVDLAIRAFAEIAHEYPDVKLVVLGDGSERDNLANMVQDLNLVNRVVFVGAVDLLTLFSYLKSALFTVVPSRAEGGGLVNVQAAACSCPVIASRAAGIAEYTKEGVTSLLFDIDDLKQFVVHMRTLLSNEELRSQLSAQGPEFAKAFSWEVVVQEYLDGYRKSFGVEVNYSGEYNSPKLQLVENQLSKVIKL